MTDSYPLHTYKYNGLLRTCTVEGTVQDKNTLAALNRIASIHKVKSAQEWSRLQVYRLDAKGNRELIADYPKTQANGVSKVHIMGSNQAGEARVVPINATTALTDRSESKTKALTFQPSPAASNVTPIRTPTTRAPRNSREDVVVIRCESLYKIREA